jgi:cell division transport system permease protein
MALNIDYVAKETASNLRRNVTLSIATVLTVAVTLTLVGSALLIRRGVQHANVQWRGDVEFIVFMNPDAAQGQIDAIQGDLDENPQIKSSTYLDHDKAYEEFVDIFERDSPELIENVTPEILPTSFKVVPTRSDERVVLALKASYEKKPGVREVVAAPEYIRQMEDFFSVISWLVVGGAAFLGVAALVLIANTIRMAMFARRREIEVMKLVGATNWFIRVPFMVEGLVQGVLGAALGIGGVLGLNHLIDTRLSKTFGFLQNFVVNSSDVTSTSMFILVAGAVVGTMGSAIAVTRFLDV